MIFVFLRWPDYVIIDPWWVVDGDRFPGDVSGAGVVDSVLEDLEALCCISSFDELKGKVFYGQEPPSGEATTTECGVNYQLYLQ